LFQVLPFLLIVLDYYPVNYNMGGEDSNFISICRYFF